MNNDFDILQNFSKCLIANADGTYSIRTSGGGGGGYTNLTEFVDQTAWRVFYSNGSGDVTELALGADGTFLRSNGASSAPTFGTPAGSGDVVKVGTPVNNQVGVWTGDGTIEGDAALTFDTTTNTLTTDIVVAALTGNVTGNVSGTAATVTGAAQAAITSVGTLTSLSSGAITSTGLLTVTVAGNTARFINSTDAASVQSLRIEGDRATPADDDEVYASFMLSGDGGTQAEFARITAVANDVNVGTNLDGFLELSVTVAGTITKKVRLRGTHFSPVSDDGIALGTTNIAWSDLFLASGAVIGFGNGDVTITHSADTLTFAGGTIALGTATATGGLTGNVTGDVTGNAGTLTVADETTDTTCFVGFYTDASGSLAGKTNTNMTFNSNTGVVTFASSVLTTTDINGGTVDGAVIGGASAAAITGTVITANTSVLPDTDGGADLGAATQAWNDLFLDTAAVINFDNGNAVITHSSGILTVSTGELRNTNAGTNTASVVTVGGTQTLTNKTLTSPAVNTATLSGHQTMLESAAFVFDPALSADGTYNGIVEVGTGGTTIAVGDLIYLAVADSRWELADASAASTSGTVKLGIAVSTSTDGNPVTVLLSGKVRGDAVFPTFTVGAQIFVSETAGDITSTAPTTTDAVIRSLGAVQDGNTIWFNPSADYATHT